MVNKVVYILLYMGLDACPVSPRQLRSLNYVIVSCGRKIFNVNSSEIAAERLKMFGVSDLAEVVATRKDRFVRKYICPVTVSSASYVLFVVKFLFFFSDFSCVFMLSHVLPDFGE